LIQEKEKAEVKGWPTGITDEIIRLATGITAIPVEKKESYDKLNYYVFTIYTRRKWNESFVKQ
jgi:hypothetical protein